MCTDKLSDKNNFADDFRSGGRIADDFRSSSRGTGLCWAGGRGADGFRSSGHRRLRLLLFFMAVAVLAAAAAVFAWTKGAFLPSWILWQEKTLEPPTEDAPTSITLDRRHLTVFKDDKAAWQSPDNVLVQDFLWCDINHDSADELILLCWRIGRYGDAKPFWVEKDEKTWSQHIYIYEWRNDEIHPLWMASDIGMDVVSFDFSETNRLCITETNQRQTYWDWLSWGLTLIKSQP